MLGGPIDLAIPKGYRHFLLHCLVRNKGRYFPIVSKEDKESRSQIFMRC